MNMGHLWGSKYNAANRPISGEIMECSTCFNSLGLPFCQGSCPLSFIYQGWALAMGLQPSMVEWINWGKAMENYYNHKFAVFPAAVPVGFQSLGLVAKPENENGPRTELGTPSVGLQRWITVIWCLTEILLTSTSWNQGCSVAVERLGFWVMIWPSLQWRPAKAKDEDDKWKSPVLIGYSNNRKYH